MRSEFTFRKMAATVYALVSFHWFVNNFPFFSAVKQLLETESNLTVISFIVLMGAFILLTTFGVSLIIFGEDN